MALYVTYLFYINIYFDTLNIVSHSIYKLNYHIDNIVSVSQNMNVTFVRVSVDHINKCIINQNIISEYQSTTSKDQNITSQQYINNDK